MTGRAHTYLLLGLPEAGKTTFLAALWNAVNFPTTDTGLTLDFLHGDRTHLNAVLASWLEAAEVPRTRLGSEQRVEMDLSGPSGDRVRLIFPDLSGETYVEQWVNRVWTKDYDDLIAQTDGLILMINPGAFTQDHRIDEVQDLVALVESDDAGLDSSEESTPWQPRTTETQIQIVDVLQFVVSDERSPKPMPVAVIVSAWDLVQREGRAPQTWIEEELPLLWQYLSSNHDIIRPEYYGISAQGGDLEGDRDRLLAVENPSERVVVVSSDVTSHDITIPLVWLLEEENRK